MNRILRPEDLTLDQRAFAVQNLDDNLEMIFPQEEVDRLKAQGKDVFDLIYIDGQSLNERYSLLTEGRPYYSAQEAMKCQLMVELMNGRDVQMVVPMRDGYRVIPVQAFGEDSRVPISDRRIPSPYTAEQLIQRIDASQRRLEERTPNEIARAEGRMRQNRPIYTRMPQLSGENVLNGRVNFYGNEHDVAKREALFRMGSAPLTKTLADSDMVTAGSGAFQDIFTRFTETSELEHPIYKQMQVREIGDLLYIDGLPAKEYLAKRGCPGLTGRKLEAGIAAVMMSGEHHVDMAKVGMDERGNFTVQVSEVRGDLHFMDGLDRWYERTRAHKAERGMRDAKGMESRQNTIRRNMSENMVQRASRELLRQENPYTVEGRRFENRGEELTATYFTDRQRAALKSAIGGHPELDRGTKQEFGGCLRLAELYLMDQHPEVRYADLMDPHKFRAEKLEAGRVVAEAIADYETLKDPTQPRPTFEKLAQVVAAAGRAAGNLNMRRELLYALGQPENMSAPQMKTLLEDPNMSIQANVFLNSLGLFGQSYYQAVGRLHPEGMVQELNAIGDRSFDVYRVVRDQELLSQEEIVDYTNATRGMRRGLVGECQWNKQITGGFDLNLPRMAGYRASMEDMRDWIIRDGRASLYTNALCLYQADLAEGMPEYLAKHKIDLQNSASELLYGRGFSAEMRKEALVCGAEVQRRAFLQDTKPWLGKDITPEELRRVENLGGFGTLNRDASAASLSRGMMMVMGSSLDDIMNASPQEKSIYGAGLLKFAEERPVKEMAPGPDRDKAVKEYAEFYKLWGEGIMAERFPNIDYSSPQQVIENARHIYTLGGMMIDFSQSEQYIRKQPGYMEEMGGIFHDKIARNMMIGQSMRIAMENMFAEHSFQQLAGMYVLQEYGPKMAGKTVGEMENHFREGEIDHRLVAAQNVLMTKTEAERRAYLDQGTLPEDVRESIEAQAKELDQAYAERMRMQDEESLRKGREAVERVPRETSERRSTSFGALSAQLASQKESKAPAKQVRVQGIPQEEPSRARQASGPRH